VRNQDNVAKLFKCQALLKAKYDPRGSVVS